jgi:hypothetical protein
VLTKSPVIKPEYFMRLKVIFRNKIALEPRAIPGCMRSNWRHQHKKRIKWHISVTRYEHHFTHSVLLARAFCQLFYFYYLNTDTDLSISRTMTPGYCFCYFNNQQHDMTVLQLLHFSAKACKYARRFSLVADNPVPSRICTTNQTSLICNQLYAFHPFVHLIPLFLNQSYR